MTPEDVQPELVRLICRAIDRIDALNQTITELNDRLRPSEPVCSHPLDMRTDFSQMGKPNRFECSRKKGGCGFRNF
jgi:hypothetical protein